MNSANNFLNASNRANVERAIAEAEKRTAAEIVCAVATESGRYDRAESVVGMIGALGGLCVPTLMHTGLITEIGEWAPLGGVALGWQAVGVAGGFVIGSIVASYWHGLRRIFVRAYEEEAETERAATLVFALARLSSTHARAGVLIYVSLAERRVVVLADRAAAEVLKQDGITALRDRAVARLHQGKRAETFIEATADAASRLAAAFPPRDDKDELPNHLMVFHPRP